MKPPSPARRRSACQSFTCVLAILVSVHAAVAGQVRVVRHGDDRLHGIDRVDILVSDPGVAGGRCGVHREALEQTAASTIRAARLDASISGKAASWFYTIAIDTRSMPTGEACATSVSAELVAQVEGIPEADRYRLDNAWGSLLVGALPLVREHALVSSPLGTHLDQVRTTLDAQLAVIGARIAAANR